MPGEYTPQCRVNIHPVKIHNKYGALDDYDLEH